MKYLLTIFLLLSCNEEKIVRQATALQKSAVVESVQPKWVTGYITSWDLNMGMGTANYGNTPYQAIDLEAMTHVIIFAFGSNADGSLNKTLDWDGTYKYGNLLHLHRRFFNDYVHSKGKPIIATFFGKGGGGDFTLALNSTVTRTALISNMMNFLRFEQYDGFDLDIEPLANTDKTNFSIFVKQLSDSLRDAKAFYDSNKPLLLTCAIYNNEQLFATLSPYFDQLNVMSYDLFGDWWGVSWHNNAVYASPTDIQVGTTDNQLATVANKITQFTKAGIPKSKLGVGIDFNGYIWKGGLLANGNGVTAPRQQWITPPTKAQFNETRYYDLKKIIDTSTTTLHFDNIAKVPYIGIDFPGNSNDTYILFQDTSTVSAIMKVVRDSSIGGVILWEVNGGYLNTTKYPAAQYPNLVRDPLLQAVKRNMDVVKPVPDAPEIVTPIQITLQSVIKWNPSATSYHLQVSHDKYFEAILLNKTGITDTEYTVTGLLPNKKYYVRVRGMNSAGVSSFSQPKLFTTSFYEENLKWEKQ